MYCRKCGYRLPDGVVRCPDCNTEARGDEYCGGFWGLVGIEKMPETVAGDYFPEENEEDALNLTPGHSEDKSQVLEQLGLQEKQGKHEYTKSGRFIRMFLVILLGGMAAVFLVLFIVQAGKISSLEQKLKVSNEKIEEMQNKLEAEEQKSAWDKLADDLEKIKDRIGNRGLSQWQDNGQNNIISQESSSDISNTTSPL